MKLSPARSSAAVESAVAAIFSLALFVTPVSSMIDCKNILADGQKFDFGQLEGPHSVVTWQKHEQPRPWEFVNATYTVDICRALEKKGGSKDSESCPNGTRVCGIKRGKHPATDDWEVIDVLAIAGELGENGGDSHGLDERLKRLKTSESHSDSQKEGVRITMSGGRVPLESNGRDQRAVIEMVCDPDKIGTEGEVDPTGEYVNVPADEASRRLRREDGDKGDEDDEGGDETPTTEHQLLKTGDKNGTALIFHSYGPMAGNGKIDVLRLTWYTKFACERDDQNGGGSSGGGGSSEHWGFFTWLILLVFLGTAAYLIFGSWLNYSRYGARGWDLLPHGDTIRDIPYLLKDWTRRVMNTVQGSGSRGGYSAV